MNNKRIIYIAIIIVILLSTIDVFAYKQVLSDFDIELQNSQNRMISRTEYYIDYLALQEEYNRQQTEQLEDLLNLLLMFA